MKHALEPTLNASGRNFGILAIALLAVLGCGRRERPPLEQAKYHFQQAQFDTAIRVIDQTVADTTAPAQIADLLALKGRCYWEMANQTQQADTRTALLQNAVETFGKSIEQQDNAEARHVRAMVYEMMGEAELAVTDKLAARRLDDSYRRAYINEKPEEVLLDRSELAATPPATLAAPEGEAEAFSPRETADADEEPGPEDSLTSREGEVAWSPQSPGRQSSDDPLPSRRGSGQAGLTAGTGQGNDGAKREGNDRPRGTRPGLPSDLAANRVLPYAEDSANTESEQSTEGDSQENDPATSDDPAGETAEPPAAPRRTPGSTWQPYVPPILYGEGTGLAPVPSTGVTGLEFDGVGPSASRTDTAPFGSQPTTGITGPTGFQRPLAPPTNLPAVPTTGIGAGPLNTTIPSGIPSPFVPFASGPSLPFTGALPPQHQPKGVTPQFGPSLPTNGPNYSPLLPSPLTTPGARGLRTQPGIPNVSTSPLVPPTRSQPPR